MSWTFICVAALILPGCTEGSTARPNDDISTMSAEEWERYKFASDCKPIQSPYQDTEAVRCASGRVLYWGRGQ